MKTYNIYLACLIGAILSSWVWAYINDIVFGIQIGLLIASLIGFVVFLLGDE